MIDANQEHAGMAVTNDVNLTPTDLLVDETTGRLLVIITNEKDVVKPRDPKIDANQENVSLASDGTNTQPLITHDDGTLYCDVLVEGAE